MAESGPWHAASPAEGAVWLAALAVPWWIAGGWALELFAGTASRPHQDLDIGIFRKDAMQVLDFLAAWEVFEAKDGVLTRLHAGVQPRAEVFSLWCRPAHARDWSLELMLDEAANGNWIYRRQRQIQRPIEVAIRRTSQGMPYLAPEINCSTNRTAPASRTRRFRAHRAAARSAQPLVAAGCSADARTRPSVAAAASRPRLSCRIRLTAQTC